MRLNVPAETVDRVRSSLDRCCTDKTFFQRFYARFLLTSDEVRQRFQGVDMRRQESVLRASLYLVLRAASGLEEGLDHLADIGRSHSRKGYDIRPPHYEHWLESLLRVVRETDREYDDEIGRAWEAVLRPCIDEIAKQGDR